MDSHMISSRLYAAQRSSQPCTGVDKHIARAKLHAVLGVDCSHHCSNLTRVTTRILVEALIVMTPSRVLPQYSSPFYKMHLNIFMKYNRGDYDNDTIPATTSFCLWRENLEERVQTYRRNCTAAKTLLGQWHCVQVY